jgi:AraC family transcriptional regulator
MLYHAFPNLQWLKHQAETRFRGRKAWNGETIGGKGWPNVVLNVSSGRTLRDDIPGPLSIFSNTSGVSEVTVDNRTTVIGDDYFFISNNTQRYTLEIPKEAVTFNIHFGEQWAPADFYNKLYPKDDVVKALQGELAAPDITTLEREEVLTRLMANLVRVHRGERTKLEHINGIKASTREEILRRLHLATDHIYSNYSSDISLDDLSKVSMLSKFHFLRMFQQAFGTSPHKFLNNVRLRKAKELLTSTDLDVTGIGRAIGMNDPSSFSRLFRRETGVYPTVFRASH